MAGDAMCRAARAPGAAVAVLLLAGCYESHLDLADGPEDGSGADHAGDGSGRDDAREVLDEPVSRVITVSPGPSCSGDHNRMGIITAAGCPTVEIRGDMRDLTAERMGWVTGASSTDWSFSLVWDDDPPPYSSDCDLDISGMTSWTASRTRDELTVTVTHSVTGYDAGRRDACGYEITGHDSVLLGRGDPPDTRVYTYPCAP